MTSPFWAAQAAYRKAIAPWFDRSWLMHRAKVKPKGYPGDAILTAIYDRLPKSPGIGGYLISTSSTPSWKAVPARLRAVREFSSTSLDRRDGDVVGAERRLRTVPRVYGGLRNPRGARPRVTCIDSDQERWISELAKRCAPERKMPDVSCVKYNALRMSSAKRNVEVFGRPDIIYSIGLFDYITDRHLVPILKGPGGDARRLRFST